MPDSSMLILGADLAGQPIAQSLRLANRHGLVAGATGTGKTVTLQRLAEQFSDAGLLSLPPILRAIYAGWAQQVSHREKLQSALPACRGLTSSLRLTP